MPPRTVAAYLAKLPRDQRRALERLRKDIKAAAPGAEECISYRMPAYRLGGRMLVWFGAASNHCSFFPGAVVDELKDDLKAYKTSKGTVRFTPDRPLPASLVRKLLTARLAAIARQRTKAKRV